MTSEATQTAYERAIADGGHEAWNALIVSLMPVGQRRVEAFVAKNRKQRSRHKEELGSDADTAIVQCVHGTLAKGTRVEDVEAFVAVAVDHALLGFDAGVFGPCPKHKSRLRAEGKGSQIPRKKELADRHECQDDSAADELEQEIMACCETDEERKIVEARSERKTFQEIEDELGISISTSQRIMKRIEARYDAQQGKSQKSERSGNGSQCLVTETDHVTAG